MTILEEKSNRGLAKSIVEGVAHVFGSHERVIVLEDDLVTSPFFLRYMNDALQLYNDAEEVACISGYIYPVKQKLPETFFIKGADCWGWATWKRAWKIFENDGRKLLSELERKALTGDFDFGGTYPYTQMLKDQINGKNNSWAILWYASAYLENRLCLYPGRSLVQNIGIDSSGTHSGTSDKWRTVLSATKVDVGLIPLEESKPAKQHIAAYFKSLNTPPVPFISRVKNKLKRILLPQPPLAPKPEYGWFGNYQDWNEVKSKCTGYDDRLILEKVKDAVLKVRNGEAVYERDSVLFDEIMYSPPLLDAFRMAADANNHKLHVVDFGGSLGSSYFQNRNFLHDLRELKWGIVEQKHFVDCGKQFIEGGHLRFFYTIREALKELDRHVLFLSSVIQYFEKPYDLIHECLDYGFSYIILDRTAFIEGNSERLTLQIVPEFIYKASYPAWFLNEKKLIAAFAEKYELVNSFDSKFDPREQLEDGTWSYRKGFLFKRVK